MPGDTNGSNSLAYFKVSMFSHGAESVRSAKGAPVDLTEGLQCGSACAVAVLADNKSSAIPVAAQLLFLRCRTVRQRHEVLPCKAQEAVLEVLVGMRMILHALGTQWLMRCILMTRPRKTL